VGKLNALKVKTSGPGKHEDGDGLRLVVSPGGAKKWVLRITVGGKRREMGLGSFPAVSLAEARENAADARRIAKAGGDPIAAREPKPASTVPTFTQAAAAYIRAHRRGWSNIRHARTWPRSLKTYAGPVIGRKPVDLVTTEDVLKILTPVWTTRTETASRVQGRIESVLDFAAAHKWRDPVNPARWRGHLDKLLPPPGRIKVVRHQPAIPYQEVSGFMAELRMMESVSARALEFLILTATRTSEVLGATWSEIDLAASVWTVPPGRMKARREHRVPLSEAAMAVLQRVPRVAGAAYIFPGARAGRPLSNMALLQLMRGMGHGVGGEISDAVPHGFRSAFRDWAGEVSSFPRDVCEMALAHVIENKVEAAYRRGDLFEKRRAMMQAWADWCAGPTGALDDLAPTASQNATHLRTDRGRD
jgi:integrase